MLAPHPVVLVERARAHFGVVHWALLRTWLVHLGVLNPATGTGTVARLVRAVPLAHLGEQRVLLLRHKPKPLSASARRGARAWRDCQCTLRDKASAREIPRLLSDDVDLRKHQHTH